MEKASNRMRAYEDITEEEVDRYFDNRIAGLEMRGETVLPSDTRENERDRTDPRVRERIKQELRVRSYPLREAPTNANLDQWISGYAEAQRLAGHPIADEKLARFLYDPDLRRRMKFKWPMKSVDWSTELAVLEWALRPEPEPSFLCGTGEMALLNGGYPCFKLDDQWQESPVWREYWPSNVAAMRQHLRWEGVEVRYFRRSTFYRENVGQRPWLSHI